MPARSDGAAEPAAAGGAANEGPLAEAERHVKEMEDLEDYYFGADKDAKMSEAAVAVGACIDRALASPEGMRPQELKSRALFLRGRASSLQPGQERSAEELLSKAIKLDPQLLDAWNALGEVYWNLRDITQAKQCFEQALELCGQNAVSLRNLSMALRALDGDEHAASRPQNFTTALAKAKEAVALGPDDPQNWETLGNAYVGDFFVNGRRPDEISRALIAYEKAERAYEKLGKRNPTLHFNRGMAAKYIEDYQLALRSFENAHSMGAAGAAEEGRKVLDIVQKLAGQVERKHDLKAKRLKELTADITRGPECRTVKELQAGENASAPLVARVVSVVDRKDEVPVICICCDAVGEFFALSVYNAELAKMAEALNPMKSLLRVQSPRFRKVGVSSPDGRSWSYPCAVVAHPGEVVVAGAGTLAAATVRSMVFSTGADRAQADKAAKEAAGQPPSRDAVFADCQRRLREAAREASAAGQGREAVLKALLPALRALVDAELGPGAGGRLGRVEAMFVRMGRGDVHTEESEQDGKRYAPGFVEGLAPNKPFHDAKALPWCKELRKRWTEIRDELRSHLEDSGVWVPGAYADSNKAYAPDWKIAGVLTADRWQAPERWKRTQAVLQRLQGVTPFEAFFARMPPHSTIAAHSDNLNYILTSHLALELEDGLCSIRVGNHECAWEEGEMLVFDTTYIHSAWNDSSRNRYVLVLRFWHPGLTAEERRAIHLSHSLLAGTPDPEKLRQGTSKSSMSITDD